jgi:RNA polymerase sigma-70 factor (ECF subfamily)
LEHHYYRRKRTTGLLDRGKRVSQDQLYREFYTYGMGIFLRCSRTREEATEIINDGFIKISFTSTNIKENYRLKDGLERS